MKTIFVTALVVIVGILGARAQHVKLTQPYALDTLMAGSIAYQKSRPDRQSGYRVQVYFGQDRQLANDIKADLLMLYPWLKVYITYDQPNFKLRAGNFMSKLEAQQVFALLREKYPSCFIVPDFIELP